MGRTDVSRVTLRPGTELAEGTGKSPEAEHVRRREWRVWMRVPWSSPLRICAAAEAVREHGNAAREHFVKTEPGPLDLGPDPTGSPTLFTGSLLASGRN